MRRALFCIPLLAAAIAADAQNVDLGTDAQRDAGRLLYEAKCIHCHGPDGEPPQVANATMRPAPRNFTAGIYKFRTTASGELPTDDDIRRSIRDGMPYTAMPPWESLSEQQVTNLMYYLKTLNDDFSGPFGEVVALDMPRAPAMSDETIARGREVYAANQCADCHGEAGRANGPSAATLEDQWGFSIRPADLTKRWTFRGGSTREDIYQTFTTGLDGSPMPSFEVEPLEDRWALVDYVYSMSRDEPEYSTFVTAAYLEGAIDLAQGDALYAASETAYFPVVGQIIEPGRAFYPGVNGVEVNAVYNQDQVAVRLRWHDMTAETSGMNAPDLSTPLLGEDDADTTAVYSDAAAVQFPTVQPEGTEMPYFMFGDRRRSVDLWFADMAKNSAVHYVGRGSDDVTAEGPSIEMVKSFDDGVWTVAFRRSRTDDEHIAFEEGAFVPVSLSIWDGFNRERGNRRGLTNWFYMYMDVAVKESPVLPMMAYGLATLLLGIVVTFLVRKNAGRSDQSA